MDSTAAPFGYPSDDDFVREFGAAPVAEGDPAVRVLHLTDELVVSFDVAAASVRCTWTVGGRRVVHLFREGATDLSIVTERGTTGLRMAFAAGTLRIRVYPDVGFDDVMLAR